LIPVKKGKSKHIGLRVVVKRQPKKRNVGQQKNRPNGLIAVFFRAGHNLKEWIVGRNIKPNTINLNTLC
jgi:hypothetical protein